MQDDEDADRGKKPKGDRGRAGDDALPASHVTIREANRSRPGSDAHSVRVADEMTDEEWLEALLELNPWARGLQITETSEELISARRAACHDRWLGGREHWNSWALRTLELKKRAPSSKPIRSRLLKISATADFSKCNFVRGDKQFAGLTFPEPAIFDDAHFEYMADFSDTQFCSNSFFTSATFEQDPAFYRASFRGIAGFIRTRFCWGASFDRAIFHRSTTFVGARFNGRADFSHVVFREEAEFGVYPGTDREIHAEFFDKATFRYAAFEGPTQFNRVSFSSSVNFRSIRSKLGFSLARTSFAQTPDFTDATFHEPPRLDNCVIEAEPAPYGLFADDPAADPRPRSLLFDMYRSDFNVARDGDEHARFRKLRKMAADAKDHENELKFNGYEIAARRFWVDKPNEGRFWLGWLYGLFSNYGQSVKRPLLAWVLLALAFGLIFFIFTPDHTRTAHGTLCHEQYRQAVAEAGAERWFAGPISQAFFISLRNASVIGQMEPSASRRMYGCLYGLEEVRAKGATSGAGEDNARPGSWPVIPPSVTVLSAIQSVLSAVLLFLTGLGLRNTFRMR